MLYTNRDRDHLSHRNQSTSRLPSRGEYEEDEAYYNASYPRTSPPPAAGQFNGSLRRRQAPPPQDYPQYYPGPTGRYEREGWATPGPENVPSPVPKRQPSTSTNASDYGVRPLSRRNSSVSRLPRSMSSDSPRRHATPLATAPPLQQPSLVEREALARQRLQNTFDTYVLNSLPTYLLRISDMTLISRTEIWEALKPRIEGLTDSQIAKLLLEQDEEARKLGVSVVDPEVQAPFDNYVRSMITFSIFSHRWGNGEPSFQDLPSRKIQVSKRTAPSGPGFQKLAKFCDKARIDYGCEYVWTDTCCINRENSAELEEAILSVPVWYSEAGICIVHLGNSVTLDDFKSEPWFTRGWTLEELLLSRKIRFYGRDWSAICPANPEGRREERTPKEGRDVVRINDKDNESVVAAISKVTGIPEPDVRNFTPSCSRIVEKMRWASQRSTSRVEDMAYSLLGLFDVTMPIIYGEGPRAFYKLMGAIAEQCTDPDFFAWLGKPSQWSLVLPSSPQCYGPHPSQGELNMPSSMFGDSSFALTKLGIRVRLVMIPVYCEPLEPTDIHTARFLITSALPAAQEPFPIHAPHLSTLPPAPNGRMQEYDHEHSREPMHNRDGRGREFALGVVDYDARAGPPGHAVIHSGKPHLCLVLEREKRGKGWIRITRPGAVTLRFRESERLPIESVCLLHRTQ